MKLLKLAFFIGLISTLFVACYSPEENDTPNAKTEEAAKVTVKATTVKTRDVPIYKTYFGQVNFKQSTTIVAEMPGTVQLLKWRAGQRVRKGQILLSYPRPDNNLDIEHKDYDQAKIAYDDLKKNYERQLILFEKGAVSKISVEQLKSQLVVQVKAMEQLQLGLEKSHSLKAPYSGIITKVHVQSGQQLAPGMPLFSIAKEKHLEVEIFVLEKDIDALHIGKQVHINNKQKHLIAKISEMAPAVDPTRRAFRVAAVLENVDQGIYAGSTVEIKLVRETIKDAVLLPEEAVFSLGEEHFVYVAKGSTAVMKKVELGQRIGLDVMVNAGFAAGDQLIIAGMEKLKNNTPISIIH